MESGGGRVVLFVYGTLMAGDENHRRLGAARFLGQARTRQGYGLVDCGAYPAMVAVNRDGDDEREPERARSRGSETERGSVWGKGGEGEGEGGSGGGSRVEGELYEVASHILAELDAYEGHPEVFVRGEVTLEDGRVALAYLMPPERAAGFPRIDSERWTRQPSPTPQP